MMMKNFRLSSKFIVIIILLLCTITTLSAAYKFEWDAAGGAGNLNNLYVDDEDEDPDPTPRRYLKGEWYNKPGYLGRFIYTGEGNNSLIFTNIGPVPEKAGKNSDKFHYTQVGHADRWRRVFFVATIIGRKHDGSRNLIFPDNNTILEKDGDVLTMPPNGAGPEQYDTSDPTYTGGFNDQGVSGTGAAFKYIYPYQYYWIDLTVIRMDKDRDLENGAYESYIGINGTGVSMTLSLGGYVDSSTRIESYAFSVERVAPDIIPFEELMQKKTLNSSYLVGYLHYNSVDKRAKIYFASDSSGTVTNFKFNSGTNNFPYKVGFKSNIPAMSLTEIASTSTKFSTTSNKIPAISPVYGEEQDQYVLYGEI